MKIKKSFASAFSLLTILPIFKREEIDEEDLKRSTPFFPLIGLILGFLTSLCFFILSLFLPKDISMLSYLLSLTFMTGGFHIDGLSDTIDGLSVKSTGQKENDIRRRLLVMSQGTQGPMGALSIVFDIILKYTLLKHAMDLSSFYKILFLVPVPSKFAMVFAMFVGKPAKKEGLGAIFLGNIGKDHMWLSFLFSLLPFFVLGFSPYTVFFVCAFFFFLFIFIYFLCKLFQSRFGGLTGDTLGAINEMTELFFLVLLIAFFKS